MCSGPETAKIPVNVLLWGLLDGALVLIGGTGLTKGCSSMSMLCMTFWIIIRVPADCSSHSLIKTRAYLPIQQQRPPESTGVAMEHKSMTNLCGLKWGTGNSRKARRLRVRCCHAILADSGRPMPWQSRASLQCYVTPCGICQTSIKQIREKEFDGLLLQALPKESMLCMIQGSCIADIEQGSPCSPESLYLLHLLLRRSTAHLTGLLLNK